MAFDDSPAAAGEAVPLGVARVGEVVGGKFRIESVLGIGGMGVVVAARHLHLDSMVAIKFPHAATVRHEVGVARFLREARAAVRIHSVHAVRIIDVDTLPNGLPYVVLEHLSGQTLAAVLAARGSVAAGEAAAHVVQACDALAEAHALGIVHRDLKPSNLFLTRGADGLPLVKVLDFGIAKAPRPSHAPSEDTGLTRSGGLLGSPAYMSPEQLRNPKDVDPRTDIWSLGVILQELITGRTPFGGDNLVEVVSRVLEQPPPPLRAAGADVPVLLEQTVSRCLEKDRERRFATIAELARALRVHASPPQDALVERIQRIAREGAAEPDRTQLATVVPETVPASAGVTFDPDTANAAHVPFFGEQAASDTVSADRPTRKVERRRFEESATSPFMRRPDLGQDSERPLPVDGALASVRLPDAAEAPRRVTPRWPGRLRALDAVALALALIVIAVLAVTLATLRPRRAVPRPPTAEPAAVDRPLASPPAARGALAADAAPRTAPSDAVRDLAAGALRPLPAAAPPPAPASASKVPRSLAPAKAASPPSATHDGPKPSKIGAPRGRKRAPATPTETESDDPLRRRW